MNMFRADLIDSNGFVVHDNLDQLGVDGSSFGGKDIVVENQRRCHDAPAPVEKSVWRCECEIHACMCGCVGG